MDASYNVPGRHTISMGPYLGVPWAPWVRQNKKKLNFTYFGVPEKKQVEKPPKPPRNAKKKKSKFRKTEAVSSKNSDCNHMANLLRLTDELANFGFRVDGPEIWPSQNWGRGGG